MSTESTSVQLASIVSKVLIGVVVGSTLLGSSNVYLVIFVFKNLLHDTSQYPCSGAKSSPLKEEGKAQKNVGNGVVQEGDGEGRCRQLPGDGGNDGSNNSGVEAKVEEGLGTVSDSEDVLSLSGHDGHGGDGSNDEERGNHGELTSNHESRKVLSITLEEELTGLAAEERSSTLIGRKLGNSEEGNLHTLQHTNDGAEEEEEEDGDTVGNTGVLVNHLCLSLEESGDDDSQGESKDGKRHEHTSPEEGKCQSSLGLFVGLDGLSRKNGEDVLDQVGRVHDTGELNGHGNVEGEESEVVVDEVDHTVGSIDLGGELSKLTCEDDHTESNIKEDCFQPSGHTEHISISTGRGTAQVDHENYQKNHELTAHEVTIQVVSQEGGGGVQVCDRVGVLVKLGVDGRKTNEGGLLSLNHREPYDGGNAHEEGGPWRSIGGELGVSGEH